MKNHILYMSLLLCGCNVHYGNKLERIVDSNYSFLIPVVKMSVDDSLNLKRIFETIHAEYPDFVMHKPGVYIAYSSDRCSGCGFTSWLYFDPKDSVNRVVSYYSKSEIGVRGDGCFSIVMDEDDFTQLSSIPFEKMPRVYSIYDGMISNSSEQVYGFVKEDDGSKALFSFHDISNCLETRCIGKDATAPVPYFLNDYRRVFELLRSHFPNKTINLNSRCI